MAPSKLRKAIGAVKDQTSIRLAKVAGSDGALADLEVAIVKATSHEDFPAEERHVREILGLTCYSRAHVAACVGAVSRRLSKTRNWVVALKALMLIHRLLTDGDPAYDQEIFFATRRGTRLLNMSDFRDAASRSESWDFSAFVRTYALYLDEQLEFRMQIRRSGRKQRRAYEEEEEREEEEEEEAAAATPAILSTPVRELKIELVYSRIHHYVHILDRFLACKPTGGARSSRMVLVALYPVVKESFVIYFDMAELLEILIDRFMELTIPDSIKVHDIFCRVAKQFQELQMFYAWCKATGIARSSDYPDVDNYPQKKLELMEDLIREKSDEKWKKRNETPEKMEVVVVEAEAEAEQDMNAIKALPPPPPQPAAAETEDFFDAMEEVVPEKKGQDIGDLLNLGEDAPTAEEHANQLALALFQGGASAAAAAATTASPWEAFSDSGDWETALVQSASHLSNQTAQLPGGFDMLLLDGMYQQGTINHAVASSGVITTGSASSVAFGSAGRPAMLALPAPTSGAAYTAQGMDPFAASLSIPPPAYVQMSEIERKQRLLMEEQLMWHQFSRDGMQGQAGFANVHQPNPYTRTYSNKY
ncbi:PREDICTED: putative clathrin assembly protein At1g03050 [Ipomoea nil]|uniref:putative clathrin assembly protein At1g03050 n=1 Tax=Ipomoea nil TaxID=35883 RepID=UPI000900A3D4|nr:PREDICTED: putative clathrin assembly protein At1g03050 [Ipomoea nil]